MNAAAQPLDAPFAGSHTRLLDYHNWIHLNRGDRVLVKRCGFAPEHGTVDDIGEDASYFWVWIDGQSRILVFHGDGTVIRKILS